MNTRCCHLCRCLPGACTRKWNCTCHGSDRRDRHDSLTDWEVAVDQEIKKKLNREARNAAYSREEAKRMTEWAAWR